MFKIAFLAASVGFVASAASAQQPAQAGLDDAVAAARNQLGVVEYCQTHGHIGPEAASSQTRMISMLPAPGDAAAADAAYDKGREGVVSALGVEQSLVEAAQLQNTDVANLCQQLEAMVIEAASALPKDTSAEGRDAPADAGAAEADAPAADGAGATPQEEAPEEKREAAPGAEAEPGAESQADPDQDAEGQSGAAAEAGSDAEAASDANTTDNGGAN